ncbi:class I SAM-dependent RNA methyltransferase [Aminobacter sp. P9b]|uniref:class I SAM-dependent RNA methyltransferase n=1 Tax=unclassified Aminobacter TaxID=2644704 RepID=UPI000D35CC66|nr:class I SAM-dependent RNA methyltransferase [Aminobacter sp. MSH1]AWC25072.1 23S rRNA (uracil(1939)-C(5))-methyltransferase RlmD [Aminobacter sp. MSH1]
MTARFEIARLGAHGDGVVDANGGHIFIPFALPGETVTAAREKDRAQLLAVIEASPQRVEPACRHFTECGGCAIQHLEDGAYRDWKRSLVVHALKARGIEASVGDLVACPPHSRRRAAFTARNTETGIHLGYNKAFSHTLVDIEECPVLLPGIVEAAGILRHLAGIIANTSKPFRFLVTSTETGFDVAASDCGKPTEAIRRAATDFVIKSKIARLSIDGEIIVEPVKPMLTFGTATVTPPTGGFVQAVADAEQAMASLVIGHLRKAKKVADLFSGSGTFSLQLATNSEVHAVEGDASALAALDRGFRFASGLKRVTVERRDLDRRPLTFKELNAFDGIAFDPPRAGAEDQCKQIARSDVPYVAAVSCNPATLARDLRILIDGGYALKSVTPIDQFLWSHHVEAVALLEKPKKRR